MSEAQTKPAFDREDMLERLGGDAELLRDVLEVFVDERARMTDEVRQAVAANDVSDIKRAAHTIKGALLNISAAPAADFALQLEQLGDSGQADGSAALLSGLEAELDRLDAELEALMAAGTA